MKKSLIFLLAIMFLIIAGIITYFLGFYENDETLRKNIEEAYYQDQFLEGCKLNSYKGFDSRKSCEDAVRCIAIEITELVRQEDLKEMSKKMKWSDDAEHTIVVYLTEEVGLSYKELDSTMQYCLAKYNYNQTASQ